MKTVSADNGNENREVVWQNSNASPSSPQEASLQSMKWHTAKLQHIFVEFLSFAFAYSAYTCTEHDSEAESIFYDELLVAVVEGCILICISIVLAKDQENC